MSRAIQLLVCVAALASPIGMAPSAAEGPTFHDCKFKGFYGRIVHVVYCPSNIPPKELAEFVLATKDPWLKKYGLVQYHFFSTQTALPKTADAFDAKSDAWIAEYHLGFSTFNNSTGHKDLWHKKRRSREFNDFSKLLKR